MAWERIVFDIEANNLLIPLLDLTTMPYKLKDSAKLWCIVVRDVDTRNSVLLLPEEFINTVAPVLMKEYYRFVNELVDVVDESGDVVGQELAPKQLIDITEYFLPDGTVLDTVYSKTFSSTYEDYLVKETSIKKGIDFNSMPKRVISKELLAKIFSNAKEVIGHNIVSYDLPMLKLWNLLDYTIAYPGSGPHTLFGKPIIVTDTLLWSKLLNPDRMDKYGKHALGAWGGRLGNAKDDYHNFEKFEWQMCSYCGQDTNVNVDIYHALNIEKDEDDWDWDTAYSMEIKLSDLTLRQEAFGFHFDENLAHWCVNDLDIKLKERSELVEPSLPPKPLNVGEQKYYTPPAKQVLKNGLPASSIFKFANKINNVTASTEDEIKALGTKSDFIITKPREDDPSAEDYYLLFEGMEFLVPFQDVVKTSLKTSIKDNDQVKGYLLSLGWDPSDWKERDLTKDSKKQIVSQEKAIKAIKKYASDTLKSPYKGHRLNFVSVPAEMLESYLLRAYQKNPSKPLKVLTSPNLRVGAEKDLCPNLERVDKDPEFVKAIVEWHTYTHRRNSISGGTLDEDGEPTKGFLSFIREDGRVSTPADTMGAASFRYTHKNICNIARPSSLYGNYMRSLFGAGPGLAQLGFDFASLEARIQAHYIMMFLGGPELAESLLAEKPNDIHTINATKLGISRDNAKAITYACLYGAAAPKLQKMLGLSPRAAEDMWQAYWDAVPPLKELKEVLTNYWEATDRSFILGIDGRKLRARSPHSLINLLFQGAGAIMAKWSVVRIAQQLEEQNLLGDPFLHSTDQVKVWQMIVYHDEIQYALHKSLLKVKSFFDPTVQKQYEEDVEAYKKALEEWEQSARDSETKPKKVKNPFEEQAKQWMKDNPIDGQYSDIGHLDSGLHYVTLPNVVSETILKAIDEAVQERKLKVPLGISWITGSTWYHCH